MASLALVCFIFAFAMTCFARSISIGNEERILVAVDCGGSQAHLPTPHHDDHCKLFSNYRDPHTLPSSGPPYDDSLNLSGNDERSLLTLDYGDPRTHPPTSNYDDYSKPLPTYKDPHTHPPTPHHDDHSKLFPYYHDPHMYLPPGPSPHGNSLNLPENSNRLAAEFDYHSIDPTP